MIKTLTEIIIALEDIMVTPVCKEDLSFNDGIRAAIMTVQSARDELYENSKEAEKRD